MYITVSNIKDVINLYNCIDNTDGDKSIGLVSGFFIYICIYKSF